MKTKITRRKMISMLSVIGGFIPFLKSDKQNIKNRESDRDFITHYCLSGSLLYANLIVAQDTSKKYNKRVIFTFNYIDVFEVYPDGEWICKRIGGGIPILGPSSEFVSYNEIDEDMDKFFAYQQNGK